MGPFRREVTLATPTTARSRAGEYARCPVSRREPFAVARLRWPYARRFLSPLWAQLDARPRAVARRRLSAKPRRVAFLVRPRLGSQSGRMLKLTYANVVASAALFLSLTGGA